MKETQKWISLTINKKGIKQFPFQLNDVFCKLNILQRDTLEYFLKNATTMFARAYKLQLEPHY